MSCLILSLRVLEHEANLLLIYVLNVDNAVGYTSIHEMIRTSMIIGRGPRGDGGGAYTD